jgi:ATP-dependent Lon protease
VLDPEQNGTFTDHYLDVPFDLSKVFFIATANYPEEIPGPLKDRMEVIQLAGYTREEKFHIARGHLVPKVLRDNGLKESQVEFTDAGLRAVIEGYTREAGVRGLERLLGSVCRKVALRVASGTTTKTVVDAAAVEELLGSRTFEDESMAREPAVGVSTGLAWTAGGGSVLFIEAISMPGTGHVHITGRLGDVMRESVDLAHSWVRSNSLAYGIEPDVFKTRDVHVHVPEGAVPKDGPSAGVTVVTALVSLFTENPVRVDLAMTGEVTLKGRVLPVGGIKEKVLAAHRAGIRHVVLPEGNRKDLKDLPDDVLSEMDVRFAQHVKDVLAEALITPRPADGNARRAPPPPPPSARPSPPPA